MYRVQYPRLVRALELSGADLARAEDVAQEAFARTLPHWRRVRNGTNPSGYVYRVAFRLARRSRYLEVTTDAETLDAQASDSDVAAEASFGVDLAAAIDAMPRGRRAVALLCMLGGVSTRDTARSLGIAESTVRKQLERARAELRDALGD